MRKNIAMQSLQILYTFVLRAEIATTFGSKRNKSVAMEKFNWNFKVQILLVCHMGQQIKLAHGRRWL
jgi:hypothetical protein